MQGRIRARHLSPATPAGEEEVADEAQPDRPDFPREKTPRGKKRVDEGEGRTELEVELRNGTAMPILNAEILVGLWTKRMEKDWRGTNEVYADRYWNLSLGGIQPGQTIRLRRYVPQAVELRIFDTHLMRMGRASEGFARLRLPRVNVRNRPRALLVAELPASPGLQVGPASSFLPRAGVHLLVQEVEIDGLDSLFPAPPEAAAKRETDTE